MEDNVAGTARESRFSVVSRSTLPEEIANRLLQQIREQELRPGDKLPAERNLAEMMQVSRPVVREALRALALMRVVDIRQGDGTYITSLEPRQLIAHLDFVFSKDSVALVQLLEARRVIESGNVRLAALRVTASDLAELETLVATLEGAIDDPERFSELDIELHIAVCAAAGNFLLLQFMNIISTLGRVSRERTGGLREVREAAMHDHRLLLEALRAHDPGAAERAMRTHLDHVEEGLRSAIDEEAASTSAPAPAAGTGAGSR
ncbi:MAG TPA: FadR/GntR family transcriptional regulator [Candidatus Limnocylindrales bacterium]|nr:FadR/GntR family transcriptional regulator [Candidatus Limnocylindrales bacterium]